MDHKPQKLSERKSNSTKAHHTKQKKTRPSKNIGKTGIRSISDEKTPKNIITKISPQKKQGRYNIDIDGEFAFGLDEQVLIDFFLVKGKVISGELKEDILQADQSQKAYQATLSYLSYQLRSEFEIRKYLIEKDFKVDIEKVIQKLKDLQLVDDQVYAETYVRSKAKINRYGPRKIRWGLLEKGVAEKWIDQALEQEYRREDRLLVARQLAEKQLKKNGRLSNRASRQKIQRFLMQAGFESAIIEAALADLDYEKSEEEEAKALAKQGNKAWTRYQKHGLETCKQKTYTNLYQKGFDGDLIRSFIGEKEGEWDEEDGLSK